MNKAISLVVALSILVCQSGETHDRDMTSAPLNPQPSSDVEFEKASNEILKVKRDFLALPAKYESRLSDTALKPLSKKKRDAAIRELLSDYNALSERIDSILFYLNINTILEEIISRLAPDATLSDAEVQAKKTALDLKLANTASSYQSVLLLIIKELVPLRVTITESRKTNHYLRLRRKVFQEASPLSSGKWVLRLIRDPAKLLSNFAPESFSKIERGEAALYLASKFTREFIFTHYRVGDTWGTSNLKLDSEVDLAVSGKTDFVLQNSRQRRMEWVNAVLSQARSLQDYELLLSMVQEDPYHGIAWSSGAGKDQKIYTHWLLKDETFKIRNSASVGYKASQSNFTMSPIAFFGKSYNKAQMEFLKTLLQGYQGTRAHDIGEIESFFQSLSATFNNLSEDNFYPAGVLKRVFGLMEENYFQNSTDNTQANAVPSLTEILNVSDDSSLQAFNAKYRLQLLGNYDSWKCMKATTWTTAFDEYDLSRKAALFEKL